MIKRKRLSSYGGIVCSEGRDDARRQWCRRPVADVAYGLWTLDVAGIQANATTDAMIQYLCKSQAEDGGWDFQSHRSTGCFITNDDDRYRRLWPAGLCEVSSESVKVQTAIERAARFADQHSLDGSHEELIGGLWLDHMLQQRQLEPQRNQRGSESRRKRRRKRRRKETAKETALESRSTEDVHRWLGDRAACRGFVESSAGGRWLVAD